jgi:tRNA A37 methylthiotransferase MiaB
VFIHGGGALKTGEIVRVRIEDADEYDLFGSLAG